jgi:hypothetical protein
VGRHSTRLGVVVERRLAKGGSSEFGRWWWRVVVLVTVYIQEYIIKLSLNEE